MRYRCDCVIYPAFADRGILFLKRCKAVTLCLGIKHLVVMEGMLSPWDGYKKLVSKPGFVSDNFAIVSAWLLAEVPILLMRLYGLVVTLVSEDICGESIPSSVEISPVLLS
jgi:hypothetical protein